MFLLDLLNLVLLFLHHKEPYCQEYLFSHEVHLSHSQYSSNYP
nr:MAG TPA: hypothetical protein [Crassvirales sp.]